MQRSPITGEDAAKRRARVLETPRRTATSPPTMTVIPAKAGIQSAPQGAPDGARMRLSPHIPTRRVTPAKAGTYSLCRHSRVPLCRHSGEGRNPVGAARRPRRGANALVSPDPHAPRHSRESGNLLEGAPPSLLAYAGIPPPSPRPPALKRRSFGAKKRSCSAQKRPIRRSKGAHSALKRRSFGAQKRSPPPGRRRPSPDPSGARAQPPKSEHARPSANSFRRLLQAVPSIMTCARCPSLRLLLS